MSVSKDDVEPTQARREGTSGISDEKSLGLENSGLYIDPAIEKRVRRKIDCHLVPLVMGLCKSSPLHVPRPDPFTYL